MTPRHGLSLIELLVVLSLMSLVAAAGISLLGDWDDSRRDEETLIQMQAVRRAILGPEVHNNHLIGRGFLQDMGFLPWEPGQLMRHDADRELSIPTWKTYTESDLFPHGQSVSFTLRVGWRGPYMNPPLTANEDDWKPIDGWGDYLKIEGPVPNPDPEHIPRSIPSGWPFSNDLDSIENRRWRTKNNSAIDGELIDRRDVFVSDDNLSLNLYYHAGGSMVITVKAAVLYPKWKINDAGDELELDIDNLLHGISGPYTIQPGSEDPLEIDINLDEIPVGTRHLVVIDSGDHNRLLAHRPIVIHPQFNPGPVTITIPPSP